MKTRCLLGFLAVFAVNSLQAQPQLVDCSCLATQSVLMTNACQAVIPDLCQFTQCWLAPTPLMCSQSPAAGTLVGPGTHPITVTFSDPFQSLTQMCLVNFVVTSPVNGPFSLLCASNKTVECDTAWGFDPPTHTNACCPHVGTPGDGVTLSVLSTITNGACPQVITQTWQAVDDCGAAATCSQTVTVVDTTPPMLDCMCLQNPALVQLNVVGCSNAIPDLCLLTASCAFDNCGPLTCTQSPPAGTLVGPGVHPITVAVHDCASNSAQCVVVFTVTPPPGGCNPCPCPTNNLLVNGSFEDGTFVNQSFGCQQLFPPSTLMTGWTVGVDEIARCDSVNSGLTASDGNLLLDLTGFGSTLPHGAVTQSVATVVGQCYRLSFDLGVDPNNPGLAGPIVVKATAGTASQPFTHNATSGFGVVWSNYGFQFTATSPSTTIIIEGVSHPPGGFFIGLDNVVLACYCDCSNACIMPPSGMVGWWPLDETCGATVFADFSGSGNAALVESGGPLCNAGSPNAVPGKVAGASFFYGPTVRGRALDDPSLNFGTGSSFSVDAWVNPVTFAGGRQPIVDKLDQPTALGYAVSILNGSVELRLGDGTLYTHNGPAVAFSTWNFIAVVVDRMANTVTFHANGISGLPQTLTVTGSINSTNDVLIGGSHAVNDSYGELALDEVEIFNRALAASEVNDLWTADRFGKCKTNAPCALSIFCPPDMTVEACGATTNVVYPAPMATTTCGMITNLTCVPASGSPFPLGTTTVTCTAKDSQGNSKSCTFTVTVTADMTPPSCPPTSMSVTGCPPIMPDFATNGLITDNCTPVGQISVVQSPLPGTVLSPGVTSATILACDAAGNCRPCQILITAIFAGALPIIICPSNIVASGYTDCDNGYTSVSYPPPQVSNGALVGCTPPSGSSFPPGPTLVTCTATNACGTNTCSFTVTVNFTATIPPCTPPPPNMVMWLKFDETAGTTAFNGSAGNHGVLVNGPVRTPGQYVVNSLCFDGVNDYVQVQPYAAMQFGTGDFSVDAWVKPATLDNTVRVIVDHREESSLVRGYSLFLGGNNGLAFQIADGNGFINYPSTLAVPADGRWHLVAVTVKRNDPQGIRFYVDGVQDSLGRDPTPYAGSVTAGPCYPFRVGSRSSSVSGLFPGCIDEVELFRRALTPAEIKAIYDARCKGKCRIPCQAGLGQILECWTNGGFSFNTIIYNPLPVPTTYTYTYVPVTGPGCTAPPPSFSPASGSVLVPANSYYFPYPQVLVTFPGGIGLGQCACYRLIIATADGSQRVECDGRFCLISGHGDVCTDPTVPVVQLTNLEPGVVTFTLTGTGTTETVLTNPVVVLRSPEGLQVSVHPLPPITVPPAGGGPVQVSDSIAMPEYDPGRIYSLALEADTDGDGQSEPLGLSQVLNVLPADEPALALDIRRGPGGGIIITWPDPCATIEVNANIANPAGWVPGPVQTSPWTFTTTPTGGALFIRLRK